MRQLVITSDLLAVPDWPGLARVFGIERTWQEKGKQHILLPLSFSACPPLTHKP